ncbi:MAG TPA: cupin domain-containing protein [Vitreimonas sp.]|nr:cupin domain-containing protein [Vitreimonas sp.]
MNTDTRPLKAAAAMAAGLLMLSAALVSASPGSGVTATIRADGTVAGATNVVIPNSIKLQAKHGLRVVNQELTIAPAGHTGWHSHPGPALVTVKSGLFRYQAADCSYVDYGPGETVVDPGGGVVHIGRNVGAGTLELDVTYLVPPATGLRIDAVAVDCP